MYKMTTTQREYDQGMQIVAVPVCIVGSCILASSVLATENGLLFFATIWGTVLICASFVMLWMKE